MSTPVCKHCRVMTPHPGFHGYCYSCYCLRKYGEPTGALPDTWSRAFRDNPLTTYSPIPGLTSSAAGRVQALLNYEGEDYYDR